MSGMGRREFVTLLGGAAAAWPIAARAQQSAMPEIGYLSSLAQDVSVQFDAAFRRGLSETGYVEGQNVSIEYRWITDSYDPLPRMAADLVERHVAVICALGPPAVLAAKAATAGIPIVFVTGADPLKFGFVASFNRPGGNITGIWIVSTVLAQKRLQLMREMLPKAESIALRQSNKSGRRAAVAGRAGRSARSRNQTQRPECSHRRGPRSSFRGTSPTAGRCTFGQCRPVLLQ
jgi:ABC-type uncharacterized transport system substrate-binding protein